MGGYEAHRGWINYLAVHQDFQGKGYGQEIMNSVETAAGNGLSQNKFADS